MQVSLSRISPHRFPIRSHTLRSYATYDKPYFPRECRTTMQVRQSFLDYFERQGHFIAPSSNLVPNNDDSLLFTSAGMVQFKDFFLDKKTPLFTRAASAQKCLRIGGKHCDLENIGRTARHQTFFEMLGNFSFGDYKKEDAIHYALEYLTKVADLPKSRLAVSVLEGDEDTAALWRNEGFPDEKIFRLGPKDNFWMMADDSGPCGPCSEIFWDQQSPVDGEQYLEIWNLVFMQYEQSRNQQGEIIRTPLQRLCIDTGMGLERLTSVIQGVPTNFDIDSMAQMRKTYLQRTVLDESAQGIDRLERDAVLHMIIDHMRAITMLITEGVVPDHGSRGYVLKKLFRRCCYGLKKLGVTSPDLLHWAFHNAIYPVIGRDDWFPELCARKQFVSDVIKAEETKTRRFMDRAISFANAIKTQRSKEKKPDDNEMNNCLVAGKAIWNLIQQDGIPFEMLKDVMGKEGLVIDMEDFFKCAATASNTDEKFASGEHQSIPPEIVKWQKQSIYPKLDVYNYQYQCVTNVLAGFIPAGQSGFERDEKGIEIRTDALGNPLQPCHYEGWISPELSIFYPEGGGQVGDVGHVQYLDSNNIVYTVAVHDTISPYMGGCALKLVGSLEALQKICAVGAQIHCEVENARREGCCRAHTATHLLQSALRELVDPSIEQAGSRVEDDELRFDFLWGEPLSEESKADIEREMLGTIGTNRYVTTKVVPLQKAFEENAIGMFAEKYPATGSRVVYVNMDVCFGTIMVKNKSSNNSQNCSLDNTQTLIYNDCSHPFWPWRLLFPKILTSVDVVRVVDVDQRSKEICCGTHVAKTQDILSFTIVSEKSIGSGKRRITALVGRKAIEAYHQDMLTRRLLEKQLKAEDIMEKILKAEQAKELLTVRMKQLMQDNKKLKQELNELRETGGNPMPQSTGTSIIGQLQGTQVHVHDLPNVLDFMNQSEFIKHCASLPDLGADSYHIILYKSWIYGCSKIPGFNNGKFLREILSQIGGKGGGGPLWGQGMLTVQPGDDGVQARRILTQVVQIGISFKN